MAGTIQPNRPDNPIWLPGNNTNGPGLTTNIVRVPALPDDFIQADENGIPQPTVLPQNYSQALQTINPLQLPQRTARLNTLQGRLNQGQALDNKDLIEYLLLNNQSTLALSIARYIERNPTQQIPRALQNIIELNLNNPNGLDFSRAQINRGGNLHLRDWITFFLLDNNIDAAVQGTLSLENANHPNITTYNLPGGVILNNGATLFNFNEVLTLPNLYIIFPFKEHKHLANLFIRKYVNNEQLSPQDETALSNHLLIYHGNLVSRAQAAQRNAAIQQQLNPIYEAMRTGQLLTNDQLLTYSQHGTSDAELARIIRKFVQNQRNPSEQNILTQQELATFYAWRMFPQENFGDSRLRGLLARTLITVNSTSSGNGTLISLLSSNPASDTNTTRLTRQEQMLLLRTIERRIVQRIVTLTTPSSSGVSPVPPTNPELQTLQQTLNWYRRALMAQNTIRSEALRNTLYGAPNCLTPQELEERYGIQLPKANPHQLEQSLRAALDQAWRDGCNAEVALITNPAERRRTQLINELGPQMAEFFLYTYPIRLGVMRTESDLQVTLLERRVQELEQNTRNNTQTIDSLLRYIATLESNITVNLDSLNGSPSQIGILNRYRIDDPAYLFQPLIDNFRSSGYGAFLPNPTGQTNTQLQEQFLSIQNHFHGGGREEALRVFSVIRTLQQLPPSVLNRLVGSQSTSINVSQIVQDVLSNNRTNPISRFVIDMMVNSDWANETSRRIDQAITAEIGHVNRGLPGILRDSPILSFFGNPGVMGSQLLSDEASGIRAYLAQLRNLRTNTHVSDIRRNYAALIREGVGLLNSIPNDPVLTPLVRQVHDRFGEEQTRRIFALITTLNRLPSPILRKLLGIHNINVQDVLNDLLNNRSTFVTSFINNTRTRSNWMQETQRRINQSIDLAVNELRESSAVNGPNGIVPQAQINQHGGEVTQQTITRLRALRTTLQNLNERTSALRGLSFAQVLRNIGLSDNSELGINIRSMAQQAETRYGTDQIRRVLANLEIYNLMPPNARRTLNPNHVPSVASGLLGSNNQLTALINTSGTQQIIGPENILSQPFAPANISPDIVIGLLANGQLENSDYSFLLGDNFSQRMQQVITQANTQVTQRTEELNALVRQQEQNIGDLAGLIRRGVPGIVQWIGSARRVSPRERREIEALVEQANQSPNLLLSNDPISALYRARLAQRLATLRISDQIEQEDALTRRIRETNQQIAQAQSRLQTSQSQLTSLNISRSAQEILVLQQEGNIEEMDNRLLGLLQQYGAGLRSFDPLWEMITRQNGTLDRLIASGRLPRNIRDLYSNNSQTAFASALQYLRRTPIHNPYANSAAYTNSLQTISSNRSMVEVTRGIAEITNISRTMTQIVNARLGGRGSDPSNPTVRTPAGTIYPNTVAFVRGMATDIERVLDRLNNSGHVGTIRTQLEELRQQREQVRGSDNGARNGVEDNLDEQIRLYENVLEIVDNPNIRRFIRNVRDDSIFNDSTWGTWWQNNGARTIGAILATAAAIALTIFTLGAASPLLVLVATAIVGSAAGIIGGELGAEINYQMQQAGGNNNYSARAMWNRVGEEVYSHDNQTGLQGTTHTITVGDVALQYGAQFGLDCGIALVSLGLARGASGVINNAIGRVIATQGGRGTISSIASSLRRMSSASPAVRRALHTEFAHQVSGLSTGTARIEVIRGLLENINNEAGYASLFIDATLMGLRRPGGGRVNGQMVEFAGGIRFNLNNRRFTYTPNHPEFAALRAHLQRQGCTVFERPNGQLVIWEPGRSPLVLGSSVTPQITTISHTELPASIRNNPTFEYANRNGRSVVVEVDPSLPTSHPAHAEVRVNPDGTRVTTIRVRNRSILSDTSVITHEIRHANRTQGLIDPIVRDSQGNITRRMTEPEYLALRALEEYQTRAARGPGEAPNGPDVTHTREIQRRIRNSDFEGAVQYAEANGLRNYMSGFRTQFQRNVRRNPATQALVQTGRTATTTLGEEVFARNELPHVLDNLERINQLESQFPDMSNPANPLRASIRRSLTQVDPNTAPASAAKLTDPVEFNNRLSHLERLADLNTNRPGATPVNIPPDVLNTLSRNGHNAGIRAISQQAQAMRTASRTQAQINEYITSRLRFEQATPAHRTSATTLADLLFPLPPSSPTYLEQRESFQSRVVELLERHPNPTEAQTFISELTELTRNGVSGSQRIFDSAHEVIVSGRGAIHGFFTEASVALNLYRTRAANGLTLGGAGIRNVSGQPLAVETTSASGVRTGTRVGTPRVGQTEITVNGVPREIDRIFTDRAGNTWYGDIKATGFAMRDAQRHNSQAEALVILARAHGTRPAYIIDSAELRPDGTLRMSAEQRTAVREVLREVRRNCPSANGFPELRIFDRAGNDITSHF